jgi:Tfp pilus assembly protein PilF
MKSSIGFMGTVLLALLVAVSGCSHAGQAASASPADAASDEAAAAKTLLELGIQLARAGDSVRAEQYLAAALEAGADPNLALFPLLKLCIKAGRFEAAAQYAEEYQRDVAAQRELDMLLSGLYVTLEQNDKAISLLTRVTQKYPDYALAHFLLARLLHDQQRELAQADQHFRSYLRLAPQGPYAVEARELLLKQVSETQHLPDLSQNEQTPDSVPAPAGETP